MSIHIKPSHRGQLHRDMGIKPGSRIPVAALMKKKSADKASGNTAGVKRDTFALNARNWSH